MPKKKAFADELKAIRLSQNFSQSEAADAWGISLRTLQGWEIEKAVPSPFVAKCVLFYLQCHKRVTENKHRV
jgi:DNA-binding transcriptional regulator YiaG